jgi:hypothetical protein
VCASNWLQIDSDTVSYAIRTDPGQIILIKPRLFSASAQASR